MKSLIIILTLALALPAFAGREGGGLYQYNNTSIRHFDTAIKTIDRNLSGLTIDVWNKIWTDLGHKPADLDEFRSVIHNAIYAPMEERSRTSRHGFEMPLAMDYELNPKSIIVLKPMFETYHKRTGLMTQNDWLYLRLAFLHEATHTFGVGIDDDSESEALSKEILSKAYLAYAVDICGANGSIDKRIADCRLVTHYHKLNYVYKSYRTTVLSLSPEANKVVYMRPRKDQFISKKELPKLVSDCDELEPLPGASKFRLPTKEEAEFIGNNTDFGRTIYFNKSESKYYHYERKDGHKRFKPAGIWNTGHVPENICVAERKDI